MKDYSSMSDAQINLAVGVTFGEKIGEEVNGRQLVNIDVQYLSSSFDPCNNPADAWVIILENKINIDHRESIKSGSMASQSGRKEIYAVDKNPLRAAMIVFLMMKDESVNAQGEKA
jgi:hypothetical protein